LGRLPFARPFLIQILFDQALLAEGGLPEEPAAYVKRVNAQLV
jgi:molecular chaperone HtpG